MIKAFLILLFLALPISAQWSESFDGDILPLRYGYTPKDTTRYYVFDVKERTKCDTFTVPAPCDDPSFAEQGMSCLVLHYQTIIECNDTTWAPKIQIYLTPIQLEQLMKLLKE